MILSIPEVVERVESHSILKIARKELKATVNSRWFAAWVVAFVGLAAVLVVIALPGSRIGGEAGFGRTGASLVTLVQVIVPLMGLSLGAASIANQRESGALRFLLSHPVSRTEAFLGIYAGQAAALGIAAGAGFGVAGIITAIRGFSDGAGSFAWIALASWTLAVGMLGLGMLIATLSSRSGSALGVAVFVWLVLVFVGDLGLMGTAAATNLPVWALLGTALLNPVEAFRLASLTLLAGSLDALGPVGVYAMDTLGGALGAVLGAVLVVWMVFPFVAALRMFNVRTDI